MALLSLNNLERGNVANLETNRLDAIVKVRRLLTEMELEAQEETPCSDKLDQMGGDICILLFENFASQG